jgi:hypothetical protein
MSTEVQDLLSKVKNSRIKMVLTNAFAGGWRIDHHKRADEGAIYLFWPAAAKKSVLVPYSGRWEDFRPAAKRMEAISGVELMPHVTESRQPDRKFVSAAATPNLETQVTAVLSDRLDALRKEHHDLSWEYKILAWGEHSTPDEIKEAREVLTRLHMIELTLLDMGQPLRERKATSTS